MPNKCPTESGKSQTAVLGKRVAHPSFGDRVWTSLYILFKYPIYRPVLTRVREYDSIRFSMATVLVFLSLQYGFLGKPYRPPIRRARAGVRDHAYTSKPPWIPNARGSGSRDFP